MSDLTADEESVLSIASTGQSMIPIGRWKEPTLALERRGLMKCNDVSNYVITDQGRAALRRDEDEPYRKVLELGSQVANARAQAEKSIEQSALHLSFAAKASAQITGDAPATCVNLWMDAVRKRALELLKDG